MQKSKKLMVSLCGLALSSLFVLNNKSVVHADTINDNNQNSAISWDSDNDDSQVVQSARTKTEQAMPQKADDIQQNATQTVQNSAETSTVRSVSSVPRTINQNNTKNSSAINDQNNRANLVSKTENVPKISKVDATVVASNDHKIEWPSNHEVILHYVNTKGQTVSGISDQHVSSNVSANKPLTVHYSVPKGYQLADPDSYYTIDYRTHTNVQWSDTQTHVFSAKPGRNGGVNIANVVKYRTHSDYVKIISSDQIGSEGGNEGVYEQFMVDYKTGKNVTTYDQEWFIDHSSMNTVLNNRVNVVLTQKTNLDPSKVNPNSPGYKITHSSATRTINIKFPGQLPPSYKNIVDEHGNVVQTVNFTRDVTVDTLLDPTDKNYVISEGPWKSDNQDPNFLGFPERTLPRIPGYTLSIKPANA